MIRDKWESAQSVWEVEIRYQYNCKFNECEPEWRYTMDKRLYMAKSATEAVKFALADEHEADLMGVRCVHEKVFVR